MSEYPNENQEAEGTTIQMGIDITEAKERFGELLEGYLLPDKVLTGDAQKLKRRLIKFCKVELQMRVK